MDPDDLATALAGQQQQQPQVPQGTNWDGRIAVNPQTGQRLVYRTNPSGHGRFMALSSETADPQSRDRVEAMQQMVSRGERTLPLAQRFVLRNAQVRTGGLQNTLEPGIRRSFLAAINPTMYANADRMNALSQQMVGANWQPGTTGMFNTATEQQMAGARYPSPQNQGPANTDVYLSMAEEVAAQRAAVDSMRNWLSTHTNLNGWEEDFRRNEPAIRQRARNEANRGIHPGSVIGAEMGRQSGGSAASGGGQPPAGIDPRDWQYLTPEQRALWQTR